MHCVTKWRGVCWFAQFKTHINEKYCNCYGFFFFFFYKCIIFSTPSGLRHRAEGWRSQLDGQTPLQRLSRFARKSELRRHVPKMTDQTSDIDIVFIVHSVWLIKLIKCCWLQLTVEKKIDKHLLPPKKIIGKNSKSLVEKRQKELEVYLQTLLSRFPAATPKVLSNFLLFHLYVSFYVLLDKKHKIALMWLQECKQKTPVLHVCHMLVKY